jgi:hypothetical protein
MMAAFKQRPVANSRRAKRKRGQDSLQRGLTLLIIL